MSGTISLGGVGVATGNTLMKLSQPLRTLALEGDARFKAIEELIKEWTPDALVIGVPFHPDGAEHDVESAGARDADSAAAALILEQFFREHE